MSVVHRLFQSKHMNTLRRICKRCGSVISIFFRACNRCKCTRIYSAKRAFLTLSLATRIFLFIFISHCLLTFFVIFPYVLDEKPFSIYYHKPPTRDEFLTVVADRNSKRFKEAQKYFQGKAPRLDPVEAKADLKNAEIVFAVTSVKRKKDNVDLGFLTQTAAVFHQQIQHATRGMRKAFIICNVEKHNDFTEATFLAQYIYMINRTNFPDNDVSNLAQKEKSDYVFCINATLQIAKNAKFIAVIEDDVLPYPHTIATVENIARSYPYVHYVKLYYAIRWLGFAFELRPIEDLAEITVLSGMLVGFIYAQLLRRLSRRVLTWFQLYITVSLGAIYGVLFCLACGRQTLMDFVRNLGPQFYRLTNAYGSNTQGILYTVEAARKIAGYLSSIKCSKNFAVDIAINNFTVNNSLSAFSVEPNLFKHIGHLSTRGSSKTDLREFMM